tara:strand:+ start:300 stop:512 length:213 start_codon:yes stop_codon:yes gene_type:complete
MSEINWHKIQRKLEGRCEVCGGDLPKHKGVCPVEGEELLAKLEKIDNSVKHISDISEALIKNFKKMRKYV